MSSTRGFLKPYPIIVAGQMSGNLTSDVTSINYLDNVSIELDFTGNAQGAFAVEGSLSYFQDIYGNEVNAGTWTPITLSPAPVAVGVNGSILLDLNQLSFPWIRVTYTAVSGTGTCDALISAKQI